MDMGSNCLEVFFARESGTIVSTRRKAVVELPASCHSSSGSPYEAHQHASSMLALLVECLNCLWSPKAIKLSFVVQFCVRSPACPHKRCFACAVGTLWPKYNPEVVKDKE
jgi:hypothetical protein